MPVFIFNNFPVELIVFSICYITFLKVEKSGIFFWHPEIRPTLTSQRIFKSLFFVYILFSVSKQDLLQQLNLVIMPTTTASYFLPVARGLYHCCHLSSLMGLIPVALAFPHPLVGPVGIPCQSLPAHTSPVPIWIQLLILGDQHLHHILCHRLHWHSSVLNRKGFLKYHKSVITKGQYPSHNRNLPEIKTSSHSWPGTDLLVQIYLMLLQ